MKPLQVILENNILWTKKKTTTTTKEVAKAGFMITVVTMKWKHFLLSYSLKLHLIISLFSRFDTITILASHSEINISPKTDELFSIFRFGWRFFLRLYIFRDITRPEKLLTATSEITLLALGGRSETSFKYNF